MFQHQEILEHNSSMWDRRVLAGCRWTVPVGPAEIDAARAGNPRIILTPQKMVPDSWLANLPGRDVLVLAGGGGQQTPIIAATGANVTVVDLSPKQLARDREVADREGLSIRTVQGSMDDLMEFGNQTFDLVIHPCSSSFIPDVKPVWREAARVLRTGGEILSGFCNPLIFIFDDQAMRQGSLVVRFRIPYSDVADLSEQERLGLAAENEPLCFGHSLADLIGAQAQAGLAIIDMYEDYWGSGPYELLDRHIASFMATRSRKL
jgi:SAM-dependent methyltransferase